MKKVILFSLVVGMIIMFGSSVMAEKKPGFVLQPQNFDCGVESDVVWFNWYEVGNAVKYSLDVDVEVDSNGDGENDMTVEFSFSTVEPFLNVPITDFVFDIDGDGTPEPVTGPATAKVKGLNPGKGKGRQNNAFSAPCEFELTELE